MYNYACVLLLTQAYTGWSRPAALLSSVCGYLTSDRRYRTITDASFEVFVEIFCVSELPFAATPDGRHSKCCLGGRGGDSRRSELRLAEFQAMGRL